MKHFKFARWARAAHGSLRAPFVCAAVVLLVATSFSALRAQAVPELGAGAPAAQDLRPDSLGAGLVAARPLQQRYAGRGLLLFRHNTPASAAPAVDYQLSAPLNDVLVRQRRSHTLAGAAAGLVIGAGATYLLLQQGGSRSFCNKDTNQDAIHARGCHGLYAAGGVVGAGVGALIGSRLGR
jgi:hypothetical protein